MVELGIAQVAPRVERRSYTDTLFTAALAAAGGVAPGPLGMGALEAAGGVYARAFAAAEVTGERAAAVTPAVLAAIGRGLIRAGESLHVIEVDGDRLVLREAHSWDVTGPVAARAWRYRVTVAGPSVTETQTAPAAGVVHCRYAVAAGEPWRGRGPLWWAKETGRLAGALEGKLADEVANAAVAQVIPLPTDGGETGDEADPHAQLKADLAGARGRTTFAESTAAGWGEGVSARPAGDWQQRRVGAHPPATLGELRMDVERCVLAACGVPPGLVDPRTDGTAQRESYRRWLHASVEPLALLVAAELSEKLETDTRLSFASLRAGDMAGRARAWRSLVGPDGKMPDADARRLAGLD